jgi:hypothetical protein
VLNRFTRMAVEMGPAQGVLRVVGYETGDDGQLPRPVTDVGGIGMAIAPA